MSENFQYKSPVRGSRETRLGKPYTKDQLRALLPKIGDVRMEEMEIGGEPKLLPCTVVYVNEKNYWYMVEFHKLGVRQAYKLPHLDWTGPREG